MSKPMEVNHMEWKHVTLCPSECISLIAKS